MHKWHFPKRRIDISLDIYRTTRPRCILISTDGPDDSVLKTKPPLCFRKANVKDVVDAIVDMFQSTTSLSNDRDDKFL